jgi:hypothetical protein
MLRAAAVHFLPDFPTDATPGSLMTKLPAVGFLDKLARLSCQIELSSGKERRC